MVKSVTPVPMHILVVLPIKLIQISQVLEPVKQLLLLEQIIFLPMPSHQTVLYTRGEVTATDS
jgi:hypothetical protein